MLLAVHNRELMKFKVERLQDTRSCGVCLLRHRRYQIVWQESQISQISWEHHMFRYLSLFSLSPIHGKIIYEGYLYVQPNTLKHRLLVAACCSHYKQNHSSRVTAQRHLEVSSVPWGSCSFVDAPCLLQMVYSGEHSI
jgi:hypothetical protein